MEQKIDSKTLFNFYLKSQNNLFILPQEISTKFIDTVNLSNRLNTYSSEGYYSPLIGAFSQYLIPDFEYLLAAGLYFSLASNGNVIFDNKYLQKISELMTKKNDPLKEFIFGPNNQIMTNQLISNFSTPIPTKVFEFLGDNFVGQAAWVAKAEQLPNQQTLVNLFLETKNLLTIINNKPFIDTFLLKELNDFLLKFSQSFSNFPEINEFVNYFLQNNFLNNNIDNWKKILESISSVLATINEFIKPMPINSKQEADKTLKMLHLLNLSQKDPNNFYLFLMNNQDNDLKNLIEEMVMEGYKHNVDKNELIKSISQNLYNTYVGILSSYFKKAIKTGDLKNGDCFFFLQIYSLSSILLDLINQNKMNTIEYNNTKQQLKTLLIMKQYNNELINSLDNPDKNVVISTLEVIRRIGQKVSPWVIQKSPDMPKDRTFWIRLNLWSKIYNSLDKNDPNYKQNKQYMLSKLRNIILSYPDTTKFSMFINNIQMNDENFDSFAKNLDTLLNTIAGFPVATTYENPDFVYSQIIRLNFLKNQQDNKNQFIKNEIHTELITKIMTRDNITNRVILDFNDYKMNLKNTNNIENSLYTVLSTFYGAVTYYL